MRATKTLCARRAPPPRCRPCRRPPGGRTPRCGECPGSSPWASRRAWIGVWCGGPGVCVYSPCGGRRAVDDTNCAQTQRVALERLAGSTSPHHGVADGGRPGRHRCVHASPVGDVLGAGLWVRVADPYEHRYDGGGVARAMGVGGRSRCPLRDGVVCAAAGLQPAPHGVSGFQGRTPSWSTESVECGVVPGVFLSGGCGDDLAAATNCLCPGRVGGVCGDDVAAQRERGLALVEAAGG